MVRPPQGNTRSGSRASLTPGLPGLHVPQVDTPEIAQEVVNASLYAPDGLQAWPASAINNQTGLGLGHRRLAPVVLSGVFEIATGASITSMRSWTCQGSTP